MYQYNSSEKALANLHVQGNDEKYFTKWSEITHFSVIYTFSILPLQDSKLKQKGFKDHFSVLIYTVSYSQ